jgi:hypothetical protein
MFDNLRESEGDRKEFEEAMGFGPTATERSATPPRPAASGLLRTTPAQRLVLAILLLLAVCVLGTMCLLVTGRISAF